MTWIVESREDKHNSLSRKCNEFSSKAEQFCLFALFFALLLFSICVLSVCLLSVCFISMCADCFILRDVNVRSMSNFSTCLLHLLIFPFWRRVIEEGQESCPSLTCHLALCPLHLCLCFSAVEDPHSIGISFTSLKLCLFSLFCLLLLCDSHLSLDHVVLFPLSLFFHSSTFKSEIGLTSSSFLH